MTLGGWIMMLSAVSGVTLLLTATPGSTEHLHSQADIETPDQKEDC